MKPKTDELGIAELDELDDVLDNLDIDDIETKEAEELDEFFDNEEFLMDNSIGDISDDEIKEELANSYGYSYSELDTLSKEDLEDELLMSRECNKKYKEKFI